MNAITPAYRRSLLAILLLAGLLMSLATLELLHLPVGAVAGDTERVSADSLGSEANGSSTLAVFSGDGNFVAFESFATDLVLGDTNGFRDIFVHDRATGQTTRVSVNSDGDQADGNSRRAAISNDGRFIAFQSSATNLVAGDTNGVRDIFVHDRQTGQTTRVSVDSSGGEADGNSGIATLNGDGLIVAFGSTATNLVTGDTNSRPDIFVHDRQTGQTTRVSVDSSGGEAHAGGSERPALSDDGRFVAFDSDATDLVAGDTNSKSDVFVHDRQTGQTTRVSVDSSGGEGDDTSSDPAISADSNFVAFESSATNLVAADTNGRSDIFVHNRQTGETTRVSIDSGGAEADADAYVPVMNADGRFVAFDSHASGLVLGDTNERGDVFVHDRQTGKTIRVSVDSTGGEGDASSGQPGISDDGRFVSFQSSAANLVAGDTNDTSDVFVHDRGLEPSPFATVPPTAAPTSTPSPTPSPTPTGGPQLAQGDNDCDGDSDSVDALKGLQHVAAIAFTQEEGCPTLGADVASFFGDVDCDGDVDSVDSLKILQFVAGLPFSQNEPCADIGEPL